MSTRTLLEINHDHLADLQTRRDLLAFVMDELATCKHNAALNQANERGRALDIGHGVRIVHQYHHSTEVAVKTEYAEVRL